MASKLKDINICISSDLKGNDEEKNLLDINYNLKDTFKPNLTIVYLNCSNYLLIKNINKILKGDCRIIVYISKLEELAIAKKKLNRKNIIVLYSNFEINNLKSHIADVILCENILGSNGNNLILIKEINRVLKQKGYYIFFESIFLNTSFYTVKSFYKKKIEPKVKIIITNIIRKLKKIKNSEYNLNISGKSNFNYNSDEVVALNNFYDFLIGLNKENKEVIFNNLDIIVKGARGI